MQDLLTASSFGLLAALVSGTALLGVILAAKFTRAHASLFGALAAGVVIAIALFHVLPEALEMGSFAPVFALAGFLLGFAIQFGLKRASTLKGVHLRTAALAPVLAIAVHSMIDGWTYAVTFSVDTLTGVSATTGLVVHEFPEAIICFLLLQRTGLSDRMSALWAFVAAGVTTAGAAIIGAPFAESLTPVMLGILFAISAGLLLQTGLSHVVRQAGQVGWFRTSPLLLAGFAVAGLLSLTHIEPTLAEIPETDESLDTHSANE